MQCVNGSASLTSWTDQLDGPAGQTSSFYLKPWPVCIFEDFPFSLYIVAASESDEGLVCVIVSGCLHCILPKLAMLRQSLTLVSLFPSSVCEARSPG